MEPMNRSTSSPGYDFIYLKTLLFIYFLKKDHERVGGVGEEGDREIIPCGLHAQRGSVLE